MVNNVKKLVVVFCLIFVASRFWRALPAPSPPRRELEYRSTLIPNPTCRDPGNLMQQLSTQPGDEARTHPNRTTIMDSEGRQHYYRVYYDKRYLDQKDWPPPSAEWD